MIRLLFALLVCSISGCQAPASTQQLDDSTQEDPTVENVPTLTLEDIFGFGKDDMIAPNQIPAETLPVANTYTINTRIIIEGQPIPVKDVKGHDQVEGMWWARKQEEVLRDLRNAEEIYGDVGLKFHVSELTYREWRPNVIDHFLNANKEPFVMTVVYMLPNGFVFDGYSSAPWELFNRGIVVSYHSDSWTVAHEIGHYFGLLHPFTKEYPENDFVDDTAVQDVKFCLGKLNATPNCGNVMQYCNHEPKKITPGQIARMQRFLRAKRLTHLARDTTDILLQGQNIPGLEGLQVQFNLNIGSDVQADRVEIESK